ncbi:VOC family protein [Caulifigura coniformis]|nr:VOC family protein [Caulifigura coniformis]
MTNKKIFVNIAVKDLKRANAFFTALGYAFNPQFSDENATCMIVSDDIFVMLLADKYFQTFTPKAVGDSTKTTAAIICLQCESREDVDAIVKKAVAAGGSTYNEAKDHGFMYQHGFMDPDGHIWELVAMAAQG